MVNFVFTTLLGGKDRATCRSNIYSNRDVFSSGKLPKGQDPTEDSGRRRWNRRISAAQKGGLGKTQLIPGMWLVVLKDGETYSNYLGT